MFQNSDSRHEAALVSVIVPIYNAERYLDQALNSIEGQTCQDIEIICVNDGSSDTSLSILLDHAERDPRISVIDKPNEGYGAACNQGISAASGEWISIIEPDDWVEPEMYADMTAFADSFDIPIDIVKTPYWRIADADTQHERKVSCSYKTSMSDCESPFTIGDHTQLLKHHPSIWSAIYRRSFLKEHDIRFLPIPGSGWADNPFLIETLCRAKAIAYLDRAYYCYRAETPEKSRSFYRNSFDIPLSRWDEMTDALESAGVDDARIWEAHCHRGFLYIGNVLKENDMSRADVRQAVEKVLARMRPEAVSELSGVPPYLKELYSSATGTPVPASMLRFRLNQLKEGLYSIRNIGLKETLRLIRG